MVGWLVGWLVGWVGGWLGGAGWESRTGTTEMRQPEVGPATRRGGSAAPRRRVRIPARVPLLASVHTCVRVFFACNVLDAVRRWRRCANPRACPPVCLRICERVRVRAKGFSLSMPLSISLHSLSILSLSLSLSPLFLFLDGFSLSPLFLFLDGFSLSQLLLVF